MSTITTSNTTSNTSKNGSEAKGSKASGKAEGKFEGKAEGKSDGERGQSSEGAVLDIADRKGGSDKKMKHLWMVEDVPASPNREARSYWTKIGVAFENRDGSWRLELAAIPVNGRLQMRDPAPRQEVAA